MPTAAEFDVILSLKDKLSAEMDRVLGDARKQMAQFESQTKSAGAAAGGFASALKQVESGANSAAGALKNAGEHASGLGGFIKNAAASAAGFIAAQVVMNSVSTAFSAGKDAIIGFNDSIDRTRIGLTSMLGSADAANSLIKDMVTFARDTPFELSGIQKLAPMLIQVGFAARDVIPTLTAVGDAVSASGRGQESVDRVVLALTQIAAKGKVAGDELMQLTEAGVAGLPILAAGFGVTTGKMSDMVEKGLVPADKALKILIEGMEARAPGAMDKMSHTWTGAVSNIHDSLTQLTAGAFKPFFDQLVAGANKFAAFLATERVQEWAGIVNGAMTNAAKGINALFSGDNAGAAQFFSNFADFATRAAQEVELAFLHIADALAPAIEPIIEWGASLAAAGLQWGSDLISSFASGMISAAGSILSQALNDIFSYIADWFPHSPAKKGPFKDIYLFGADILNSLFQGMTQADFGALDGVMKSVTDILNTQLNNGQFGKEGLIPAIVGSEAGVAQAIADMHEFGAISEETLATLGKYLGQDAPLVAELIQQFAALAEIDSQLADLKIQVTEFDKAITSAQRAVNTAEREIRAAERAMGDIERQIRTAQRAIEDWDRVIQQAERAMAGTERAIAAVDRQIRNLNQAYELQKRPVQDALDLLTRYYDKALRGADDVLASINREIDARRRLRQGELNALDTASRQDRLGAVQLDLDEAQNAVTERRARLLGDVASAQRSLDSAQHGLTTLGAGADAYSRQQAQLAVDDARNRLAQASNTLATQGQETARDRLRIDQARQGVLEAQLAVENTQNDHARTAATDRRNDLEWTRDQALRPIQDHLQDINDEYNRSLRILEDQKKPLEALRQTQEDAVQQLKDAKIPLEDYLQGLKDAKQPLDDHIQALKDAKIPLDDNLQSWLDQKQAATDQIAELEAQKAPIEAAIKLTETRLAHEREISGEIKSQLDLLNQMATAGGAGGAGAHGGAGGLGKPALGGALGPGGLGLPSKPKPGDRSTSFEDVEAMAREATARQAQLDGQIASLTEKVKREFSKAVIDGFSKGFDDFTKLDTVFVVTGALIGAKMGGPMGAAAGAAFGKAFADNLQSGDAKTQWDTALLGIAGGIAGAMLGGPFGAVIGAGIAGSFGGALSKFSKEFTWSDVGEFGGNIVKGIIGGVRDAWEGFTDFFTDRWDYAVKQIKDFLGISSPSTVFAEIGGDIVQGAWDGISDKWDSFTGWVGEHWGSFIDDVKHILGIGGNNSSVFKDIGGNIVQGAWDGITDKWDAFTGWVAKAWNGLVATVKDLLGIKSPSTVFFDIGLDIMAGLLDGAAKKWTEVRKWFEDLPGNIKDAIGEVSETLKGKGGDLLTGLWNGMKSIWEGLTGIAGWLFQLAARALEAIGDVSKSLWNKGVEFIDGLWNGLKSKWGDVEGWLRGRAQAALDALGQFNPFDRYEAPRQNTWDTGSQISPQDIQTHTNLLNTASAAATSALVNGPWIPGPNGTQIQWTGPQTYNVRFPDGRRGNFSTLDPSAPLSQASTASGASGGSVGPATLPPGFYASQGFGSPTPSALPGTAGGNNPQSNVDAFKGALSQCASNPSGVAQIPSPQGGIETIPCWELMGIGSWQQLFPGLNPINFGIAKPVVGPGGPGGGGGYVGNNGGPPIVNNFYGNNYGFDNFTKAVIDAQNQAQNGHY